MTQPIPLFRECVESYKRDLLLLSAPCFEVFLALRIIALLSKSGRMGFRIARKFGRSTRRRSIFAVMNNFNGTFRDDCLNQHWFASLAEARLEHWRSHDYNRLRRHSSIARVPPDVFALPFLNSQPNKSVILNPAAA